MRRIACAIAAALFAVCAVVAVPASADAATSQARHGNDWE